MSLIINTLTLSYAVGKGLDLLERKNPVMSENTIEQYYGSNDRLNLNEVNFRLAFGVRGALDSEFRDD